MFDLFDGLPLHALVVHAVVVLAPLTALLAVIYAIAPARRWGLRVPLAVMAIVTGVSGFVAGESGEKLEHRVGEPGNAVLHEHTEAGDILKVLCVAFMLLVLLAVFLLLKAHRPELEDPLDGSTRDGAGPVARGGAARGPLALVTAAALVLASCGVVYQTVVTGHTGARSVWGDVSAKP